MLEAASCGLLVVSTDVGGIPEVLPAGMAYMAKPDAKSLCVQLFRAIQDYDKISCSEMHQIVKNTYSWRMVAQRTEFAYDFAMEQPDLDTYERVKSSFAWGPAIGLIAVFFTVFEFLIMAVAEYFRPADEICAVRAFQTENYVKRPQKYGDHEFRVKSLAEPKGAQLPPGRIKDAFDKDSAHNKFKRKLQKDGQRIFKSNRNCTFKYFEE